MVESARDNEDPSQVKISVVVISWNTRDILKECLKHLPASLGDLKHEVIVVDNSSSDGSQEMVRDVFPAVILIENEENLGFPSAVNQGMLVSHGDQIAVMNSDAMAPPGALKKLSEHLDTNADVAAVGPQLLGREGNLQYSGGFAPSMMAAFCQMVGVQGLMGRRTRGLFIRSRSTAKPLALDWLCAACMVIRRQVIDKVGMFDDTHFMYAEDMEYGLRLRQKGWKLHLVPWVRVVHYGGASSIKVPQTKLLWMGGLFRVAGEHLSRSRYIMFGLLLSFAFLERSIFSAATQVMPGRDRGITPAREIRLYSKTAFKLALKNPKNAQAFCADLENSCRDALVRKTSA